MNDNIIYQLTLKGLIWKALDKNLTGYDISEITNEVLDAIELYCRRHGANAALFIDDDNQFTNGNFVEIEHERE